MQSIAGAVAAGAGAESGGGAGGGSSVAPTTASTPAATVKQIMTGLLDRLPQDFVLAVLQEKAKPLLLSKNGPFVDVHALLNLSMDIRENILNSKDFCVDCLRKKQLLVLPTLTNVTICEVGPNLPSSQPLPKDLVNGRIGCGMNPRNNARPKIP